MRKIKTYQIFESERKGGNKHREYGIYQGHIGLLQYWGWKGIYIFSDFETGEVIKLDSTAKDVEVLSKEEGQKVVEERNYRVPKEGEEFTARQKSYGKIHDNMLKSFFQNDDSCHSGQYTDGFCREVAYLVANLGFINELYNEMETTKEELLKNDKDKFQKTLYKYHLTPDCDYSQWCEKMGLHGEIEVTESEIISKIKEAYHFLDKFGLKEEDLFMIGDQSEEMEYYKNKASE